MAKRNSPKPGNPAVLGTLVVMFLLGALLVPAVSRQLGMVAYDLETGRGRVAVTSCEGGPLWRECTGTLTEWTVEKHQMGDRVTVMGRSALSGTVEVVGRVRGVSSIDEYKQTNVATEDVLLPADVWVMPGWVRLPVLLGLGLVWAALMWAATRLAAAHSQGSSADGRGR